MKSVFVKALKIILPLAVGIYLLWFFFQQMEEEQLTEFYKAIRNANYWWIFLSLILSFLAFVIRAERWKLTLEPLGYETKFKHRYHSLMIGYIINMTIPRAGEASRSVMLYRSEKVPFAKSFGTIISERIIDMVFLVSIAFLTYLLNIHNFGKIFDEIQTTFGINKDGSTKWIIYAVGLGLALIGLGIYFFVPTLKQKINQFISGLFSGLLSVFKMRKFGLYFLYSFLIWGLYVVYFYVCFLSISETSTIPFNTVLLAFIAGSLGIVFTNGGIGAFPLLIGIVIGITEQNTMPNAQAIGNALGMIIWSFQTLLVILLGMISLILLPKPYGKELSTTNK